MKTRHFKILSGLLLSSTVVLTACTSTSNQTNGSGNVSNTTTGNTATSQAQQISTFNFSLPEQIKWQQSKNLSKKNGGVVAEWIPQGTQLNNTQVRAIYQRLIPAVSNASLLQQIIRPLKKSCSDIRVTPFKAETSHAGALGQRVICSKLGKSPFGIVLDAVVMSDANASHLLISEVKTPASVKAGEIQPKTDKEKIALENTNKLISVMYASIQTARACDKNKQCR